MCLNKVGHEQNIFLLIEFIYLLINIFIYLFIYGRVGSSSAV